MIRIKKIKTQKPHHKNKKKKKQKKKKLHLPKKNPPKLPGNATTPTFLHDARASRLGEGEVKW